MLLEGKRILIIEDNADNLVIMKPLLEQHGAVVSFERWGTTFFERIESFYPVDAIVLDLMFPNGITGYDIFEQLQTVSQYRHIPVVAVSGAEPSEAAQRVKALGFMGFIAKPIDYDNFPQQIAAIIEKKSVWDLG